MATSSSSHILSQRFHCVLTDSFHPKIEEAAQRTAELVKLVLSTFETEFIHFTLPSAPLEPPPPATVTNLHAFANEYDPARPPQPPITFITTDNLTQAQANTAVQNSTLWIYLTEGKDELTEFIQQLFRIHDPSHPTILILFIRPPESPHQAYTNLLSESRHVLVLYHSLNTHEVYIVSARGCFAPLAGFGPTVEDEERWERCAWNQMTRIRYQDLGAVKIPKTVRFEIEGNKLKFTTKEKGKGLVVEGGGLYTKAEHDKWVAARDKVRIVDLVHLRNVVEMAKKDQDTSEMMVLGIRSGKERKDEIRRVDIDGESWWNFSCLMFNLDLRINKDITVPESQFEYYRSELRAANTSNYKLFRSTVEMANKEKYNKEMDTQSSYLLPTTEAEPMFFRGFFRAPVVNRDTSEFRGTCTLCHGEDLILCLLIHPPRPLHAAIRASHHLIFSDPRSQVFDTDFILCEMCANNIEDGDNEAIIELVIGVLPLVSVVDNLGAYMQVLRKVVGQEEDGDEMELVSAVVKGLGVRGYDEGELGRAVKWLEKDLRKWVDVHSKER